MWWECGGNCFVLYYANLTSCEKNNGRKEDSNKIINGRGDITTDTTEIRRITRGYCEQLFAKKVDNLEEMDTFLETHKSRLNHEERDSLNGPITRRLKQNKKPPN